MKAGIVQLKQVIAEARVRQDEAAKEAKRIEKDMIDFNNNKDSKLIELQTSLDKLTKSLSKNSAAVKPLQQEVRDAMLESEQCGSDLAAAQEELQDAETTLKTQQEEVAALVAEQKAVKVSTCSLESETFEGPGTNGSNSRMLTTSPKHISTTNGRNYRASTRSCKTWKPPHAQRRPRSAKKHSKRKS